MKFVCCLLLILCVLLFINVTAFSQEKSVISGQVLDSESHKPLTGATVMISHLHDSASIGKAVTDKSGLFSVSNVVMKDSLLLRISYSGFDEFQGILVVTQTHFFIEPVLLQQEVKSLQGITISSVPRLMVVKGDTTEFKASNYTLAPNAMAQDLIRRLPGLTVDPQGKLYFNGRPVTTILVDGKVFFSSDGGIALNNIPVDMIDKIQIADTKTEEEKLLGSKASGHESTLNIKLKAGNKIIGNASAGIGTDNRYEAFGLASFIHGKQQLNVLSGINNTNHSSNGTAAIVTNGGGITRALSTGIGYNNTFNDKTLLEVNYLFNRPVTYRETVLQAEQTILPDSAFNNSSVSDYLNKNTSHSLDMKLSNGSRGFSFHTKITDDRMDNNTHTIQHTTDQDGQQLNALSGEYETKNNSLNWNSDFTYRKKLSEKGRLLVVSGKFGLVRQNEHDLNTASTLFYKSNAVDSSSVLRQKSNIDNSSNQFSVAVNYQEPVNKFFVFTMENRFYNTDQSINKTTIDLDANNEPIGVDSLYSNIFHSLVRSNSTGVGFKYYKNYRKGVAVSIYLNDQYQRRTDISTGHTLSYSFLRALPLISVDYPIPKIGDLYIRSIGASNNPTPDQLQPVQDNSNPFLIKQGNPALKPSVSYKNDLSIAKAFAGKIPATINFILSYTPIVDQITTSISYDSLARQTIQFRNINGTYITTMGFEGTITFTQGEKIYGADMGISNSKAHNRQYLDGLPFASNSESVNYYAGINYYKGAEMDIRVFYGIAPTSIYYEQSKEATRRYVVQSGEVSVNLLLFKRIKWNNSVTYMHNSDIAPGLKKSSALCTSGLSWLCMHNQKGEIKLTGFDLLRQSHNISRIITASSITDTQTNNLQQYFLVGFTYHFDQMKK